MKRNPILVVAALVLGSYAAAAPTAANASVCDPGTPPPATVVVNSPGRIDIYPDRLDDDAASVVAWLSPYIACMEGGTIYWTARCVDNNVPDDPIVTVDPSTLHITIHYGQLVPDPDNPCRW